MTARDIIEQIKKLRDEEQQEVFDAVDALKSAKDVDPVTNRDDHGKEHPFRKAIGSLSFDPIAPEEIDRELYGELHQ